MALSQKRKVSDWRKTSTTKRRKIEKDAKIITSRPEQTISSEHCYYLRSGSTNRAKGSNKKQNIQQLRLKRLQRKIKYSVKTTAGTRVKRASHPKVSVKRLESSRVCKLQKSEKKDSARSKGIVSKIASTKLVGKRNTLGKLGSSRTSGRQVSGQSSLVFSGVSSSRADNRTFDKIVPSGSRTMSGGRTREATATSPSGKRISLGDNSSKASASKSYVSKRTLDEPTPPSKPVSQTLKRPLPFNSTKATFVKHSKVTRYNQNFDRDVSVIASSSRATEPADCANMEKFPSSLSSKGSSGKKSRNKQTVAGPASSDSTHSKTVSVCSTGSKKLQSNSTSKNTLPGAAIASTSTLAVATRSQKMNVASSLVPKPIPPRQGRLMGDKASASTSSSISTSLRPTKQTSPDQAQKVSPPAINYQYPTLADLSKHIPPDPASSPPKKAEERVNVYGVVEYFKPPTRTSGMDYIMVVVLSDESFQQEQVNGFRCCLFGRSPEVLPKVTSIGDVLRLHRIKLVKHGGMVYGQSSPGWAGLVFPKNGDPPISTSEHFNLTAKDHRRVAKLRKLAPRLTLEATIQNVRHGTYVDISCQVVAVKIINAERAALRVWDGTKLSSGCQSYGFNEEDVPQDLRDASDGFTVDVLVFDDHRTEAESLNPGDMIQLVNVTADHGRMNPDDFGLIMRGGSSYGRGIKTLDRGSCDYQTLEARLNRVRNADSDAV
ncbi:uncharacterized protein LOC135490960 [Lineus longissimus]|uniref:uncharacterized protein LOC135490960 n=1 Tax=Lineus longissimus TaxID=88925 RepID=UPI00315CD679